MSAEQLQTIPLINCKGKAIEAQIEGNLEELLADALEKSKIIYYQRLAPSYIEAARFIINNYDLKYVGSNTLASPDTNRSTRRLPSDSNHLRRVEDKMSGVDTPASRHYVVSAAASGVRLTGR